MRRWTIRAPNGESVRFSWCVECTNDENNVCEARGARSRRAGDGVARKNPKSSLREAARRRRGRERGGRCDGGQYAHPTANQSVFSWCVECKYDAVDVCKASGARYQREWGLW